MRYLALIMTLLLLAACGDGDDSVADDETNLSPLGERLTETHCARLLSCCDEAERAAAFQGIPVADAEQCASSVEGIVQVNVLPRYEEAIEAGTITYDADAIQGCVDGIERLACNEFEPDPRAALREVPGCRGLFAPQLETTEFCQDDFECKSGFCAISAGAAEGTCAELPGEGEPCIAEECGSGLYCADGVCEAVSPEGFSCSLDRECATANCVDVSQDASGDFQCQPLPPACGG